MPVTPQEEKWIFFWRISFRICREDARVQRCFRRFWVYYCFVRFGICLISLAHHFCLLFPVSAACRCPFKLCIVSVWVALLIKSSLNTQKKKKKKTSIDALLQGFSCNWPRRLLVRELSMNLPGTHRTSYMHVGAKNTNITPSWNTPHILHACWS